MNISKDLYFHECEIKFKLDEMDETEIYDSLIKNGFSLKEDIMETDYTPDVEGFLCKNNNIVLRIRLITGTQNDCLITLKINKKNEAFQDNLELEFLGSDICQEKLIEMNRILEQITQHTIPEQISTVRDINEIIELMKMAGFVEKRMLSQKKRKTLTNGEINVSFDTFPKNIGKYMEVEATSPIKLENFIDQMKYDRSKIETLNYGKLIQKKQSDLDEKERRICLF